jgi:GxxExxY protein
VRLQRCQRIGKRLSGKVYESALAHELRKSGLAVQQQKHVCVIYDGIVVGDYAADLLVQESVVVELKTAKALEDIHIAQCLNYLKATGLNVCLLISFGSPRVQIKSLVNQF